MEYPALHSWAVPVPAHLLLHIPGRVAAEPQGVKRPAARVVAVRAARQEHAYRLERLDAHVARVLGATHQDLGGAGRVEIAGQPKGGEGGIGIVITTGSGVDLSTWVAVMLWHE